MLGRVEWSGEEFLCVALVTSNGFFSATHSSVSGGRGQGQWANQDSMLFCCFGLEKVKPATQNVPDVFPRVPPIRSVGQLQLCNIILTWADSEDANETDIHYF